MSGIKTHVGAVLRRCALFTLFVMIGTVPGVGASSLQNTVAYAGTNAASLSVSPASVYPGTSVTVSGSGFVRNQQASVRVNGAAVASIRVANSGTFSLSWSVPSSQASGSVTIQAVAKSSSATAKLTILAREAPSLSWVTPPPMTYGASLSSAQLDATANVPGTFAYTPTTGTVLPAGDHVLTAIFTPTNTTQYLSGTQVQVTQHVNQATPVISWPTPAAVAYGTALSATQLDATANVPGTFVYSPASGSVLSAGVHTLSATFTPSDSANYASGTRAEVSLSVAQASPVLAWLTPAAVTYGTALSATQLNASANVPGTFSYSPASGTVLSAGDHTLSATFTPNDGTDYSGAGQVSVTEHVSQASPAISWTTPSAIQYGTPLSSSQLDASSNVPGSFAYSPGAGTILPGGTNVLRTTFTPTDATNYASATASVNLSVAGNTLPTLSWSTPAAITYGTGLGSSQLNATSNVPGSFSYSPSIGRVLSAGVHTLSATFTPTDIQDYASGTQIQTTIQVNQAAPVLSWSSPAAVSYGTPLTSTQLDATANIPGGFAYNPSPGKVLSAGSNTLTVTFTPTDGTNFVSGIQAQVTLQVNPVVPVITWLTPSAITYGAALSGTQLDATANIPGIFTYSAATGTTLSAGSHALTATFAPSDATDYVGGTQTSVTLQVNQAVPAVVWATPAAITYGTALSGSQLDASANVAGSFSYNPAAGAVLPGGSDTLSTTFTPTDSTDYTSGVRASVILQVNQPAPQPTVSDVFWGATLRDHNDGDPYMPSNCVNDPPWSTTNHDACDPWNVWRSTISNKTDSLLALGNSWVQTDAHGNDQWADFTYLGLAQQFNTIRSMGAIPFLTWMSDPNMLPDNQAPTAFADRNIAANGTYTPPCANPSYVCAPTRHFNDYVYAWGQEAAAYGHPFFLRFDHEMNGNWFPWGVGDATNNNTAAEFVAMWKHVHNIFDCVSDATFTAPAGCVPATNVTWVWCPNVESATSPDPVSGVFPSGTDAAGRPYVDWTGLDAYNTPSNQLGNWFTFQNLLSGGTTPSGAATNLGNSYQDILKVAPNAPIMLAEFASTQSSTDASAKATWIHDALQTYLPNDYPNIKAIIWSNFDDNSNGGQYPVEDTSADQAAWQQGIASSYYQPSDPTDSFGGSVQDMKPVAPLGAGRTGTTTAVTSGLNPSTSGQAVTFTATISPAPPSGETVNFLNGGLPLGSAAVNGSGVATYSASLPTGTDNVTATYPGDASYTPSTSTPVAQVVNLPPSANILQNPSFDSGSLSPWTLHLQGGAAATVALDTTTGSDGGASAAVTVTSANSSCPWYVQESETNLALQSNQGYAVSFWAKASTDRSITVGLQQVASPYTTYAQQTFNLTTSWQPFAFTMSAQTVADANTALRFNLAGAIGTVWLDQASLGAYTPTASAAARGVSFRI